MPFHILSAVNIQPLEELLINNGNIVPIEYSRLERFTQSQVSTFCHTHGLYQIPTMGKNPLSEV